MTGRQCPCNESTDTVIVYGMSMVEHEIGLLGIRKPAEGFCTDCWKTFRRTGKRRRKHVRKVRCSCSSLRGRGGGCLRDFGKRFRRQAIWRQHTGGNISYLKAARMWFWILAGDNAAERQRAIQTACQLHGRAKRLGLENRKKSERWRMECGKLNENRAGTRKRNQPPGRMERSDRIFTGRNETGEIRYLENIL